MVAPDVDVWAIAAVWPLYVSENVTLFVAVVDADANVNVCVRSDDPGPAYDPTATPATLAVQVPDQAELANVMAAVKTAVP